MCRKEVLVTSGLGVRPAPGAGVVLTARHSGGFIPFPVPLAAMVLAPPGLVLVLQRV